VPDTVFVGDFRIGRRILDEQTVNFAIVVVQHEDLSEMSAGGLEKLEPVSLRLCESLLVAKDDAGRVVLDPAKCDETSTFHFRLGSRHGKRLRVDVDRGLGILQKNALPPPVAEEVCCAGVDVASVVVSRFALAKD